MEHKKFFKTIMIITASFLGLMLALQVLKYPMRQEKHRERTQALKEHVAALVRTNQELLTATAQSIKSLPVDPMVVNRIQSDFFQRQLDVRLFLWMTGPDGSFLFGIPTETFSKLNSFYDNLTANLPDRKPIMSRNEFLLQYSDRAQRVDLSANEVLVLESLALERPFRDVFEELRQEDYDEMFYVRPRTFTLSSPVVGENNASLGNLFLKVDDSANRELYFTRERAERRDFFGRFQEPIEAFTILPLLILWFLLPTWVYLDARRRDIRNVGVWVVLTAVASIFGFIVYLVVRPAGEKVLHCAQCGKEINGSKSFCPYCGNDVSKYFCPACQYPVKPDWEFCPSCRAVVNPRDDRKEKKKP